MKQIGVASVGTGWCGGIRAETCAAHPLVKSLHLAEIRPDRLEEMAAKTERAHRDHGLQEASGEEGHRRGLHLRDARRHAFSDGARLSRRGKHVFLEKPIALKLAEADELINLSRKNKLKFTIGYSQRFNPKFAYVRKSIRDGTIGKPVSALVSRHITRSLGKKISGRIKLSPAAMESTHDLDFVLWCLEPAKPVRVYSQVNYGAMRASTGAPMRRHAVDHGDAGQRPVVRGRRRLEPAARLPELLHHLDRDGRHRGRGDGRRLATATWC